MRGPGEVEVITQISIFCDQVDISSRNSYLAPIVHDILH